jgi:ADP-ribose pyrophosphatase
MQPWKTLSKKTILKHSKFLHVEDHAVELPDGRVISDWAWVTTPDFVNVMVEAEDGKFLFFKQTKYALAGVVLAPVGGFIDPGEQPEQAAKRELLEEAGYEAAVWINLGSYRIDPSRGIAVAHLFLARGGRSVAEPNGDDLEEQHIVKLTLAEVEAALAKGEFKVLAWATLVALSLRHL